MIRRFALAAGFVLIAAGASAQPYYGAPPPYGYAPRPVRPLGGHCRAFFRAPDGEPRHFVCPLYEPRPIEARCECPANYPNLPPAPGHVIP